MLETTVDSAVSSSAQLLAAGTSYVPAVEYPQSSFGSGMSLLAETVVAELGMRVGHITLGGFDTHSNELADHAALMETFDQGISAFYQDLEAQGKADDVLVKKLHTLPNVSVVLNAKTNEVIGNGDKVVGLSYQDRVQEKDSRIDLDGIFVQIGLSPNSGIVKNLVEVNKFGEIVVDGKGRTSTPGIYAAGDVTTVPYKQIVIAMGEGAKVALTAFEDRMRS